MTRYKVLLGCIVLAGAAVFLFSSQAAGRVTLKHIHGLSFSADGTQLFLPSHHGLAIYDKNGWGLAPGPTHDYMGFAVTRDSFYSSGHPAPGSPLPNPFGLIKSKNGGQTWESLALSGEADFHLLATSYQTNAVYVFNPAANSRMPQPGLYHTTNDRTQWQRAQAAGVAGQLRCLAAHPTQAQIIAMGTKNGLFLSRDVGEQFHPLMQGTQVLALFFAFDGQHLWVSSFDGTPSLTRLEWQTGQMVPLILPPMEKDAVSYIAQNPVHTREWAIATFQRDVYVSADSGTTWKHIAKQGRTLEVNP